MAKFQKKSSTNPTISTASLPDIIFMLLFFFMVTTVLRKNNLMVEQRIPQAEQLRKLERKDLVSYLYIGEPKNTKEFGTEPKIQANDQFIDPAGVIQFVQQEKDQLNENERDQITISLKVDEDAKMGIVSDVQQKLREVNARKIMYASTKKPEKKM